VRSGPSATWPRYGPAHTRPGQRGPGTEPVPRRSNCRGGRRGWFKRPPDFHPFHSWAVDFVLGGGFQAPHSHKGRAPDSSGLRERKPVRPARGQTPTHLPQEGIGTRTPTACSPRRPQTGPNANMDAFGPTNGRGACGTRQVNFLGRGRGPGRGSLSRVGLIKKKQLVSPSYGGGLAPGGRGPSFAGGNAHQVETGMRGRHKPDTNTLQTGRRVLTRRLGDFKAVVGSSLRARASSPKQGKNAG